MKFLCLNCDEGMKLKLLADHTRAHWRQSFACPRCRYQIVMPTNPWETQLVQTLGSDGWGRAAPASPYEQILESLRTGEKPREGAIRNTAGGCPFAEMFGQAEQAAADGHAMGRCGSSSS